MKFETYNNSNKFQSNWEYYVLLFTMYTALTLFTLRNKNWNATLWNKFFIVPLWIDTNTEIESTLNVHFSVS